MGVRNPDRFVRDNGSGSGSTVIADSDGDELAVNPDGSINVAGVTISGPVTVSNEVEVKNDVGSPVPVSDATLQGKIPDEEGTWTYYAGTSGTVTVGTKLGAGERVIGIAAAVVSSGGTIQINGGDIIPIPFPGTGQPVVGVDLAPRGNLVDPVIIFGGTASYMVEVVR